MVEEHDERWPMRRPVWTGICLAVALSVVGGAFWWAQERPRQAAAPRQNVTIANARQPVGGLVYIAFAMGYFESEGLDVNLQPHTSGRDALGATLAGKADLAMVADTPIVHAVLRGERPHMIATIGTSERNMAVVGRTDRGITSPAALKGKKIGASQGTNGEFFLEVFLVTHQIPRDQVDIVNLNPEQLTDALVNGEVDAVSTWEPFISTLQKDLAGNGTAFYGDGFYTWTWNVVGTRAYTEKNPATITKVLRAVSKAASFARKNPDRAHQAIANQLGMDRAVLDGVLARVDLSVGLDQGLLVGLEAQARWAIKMNYTDQAAVPNFLAVLYLDGLDAVNRDAVTVIR